MAENFGYILRNIRQTSLKTQKEFSAEIEVGESTLNRWENGKKLPKISMLRRLTAYCEALGYDTTELRKSWQNEKNGVE